MPLNLFIYSHIRNIFLLTISVQISLFVVITRHKIYCSTLWNLVTWWLSQLSVKCRKSDFFCNGVRLSPWHCNLWRSHCPTPEMSVIDRKNRRIRRKPVPVPQYTPQIEHEPTQAGISDSAVRSEWLTRLSYGTTHTGWLNIASCAFVFLTQSLQDFKKKHVESCVSCKKHIESEVNCKKHVETGSSCKTQKLTVMLTVKHVVTVVSVVKHRFCKWC